MQYIYLILFNIIILCYNLYTSYNNMQNNIDFIIYNNNNTIVTKHKAYNTYIVQHAFNYDNRQLLIMK